jgi:hypothetical protein
MNTTPPRNPPFYEGTYELHNFYRQKNRECCPRVQKRLVDRSRVEMAWSWARALALLFLCDVARAASSPLTLGPGNKVIGTGRAHPGTWTPLPLGQCSGLALAQSTGASLSQTTCGLQAGASVMPSALLGSNFMAVSGDLFMSRPLQGQDEGTFCANEKADCASGCGECYLLTGSQGSALAIVTGFISGATAYGQGDTFFIPQPVIDQAYLPGERGRGVYGATYKKVPCPVSGTIYAVVTSYNSVWDGLNLELGFVNHRVGISSISILPRTASDGTAAMLSASRSVINRIQWFPGKNITQSIPCIFGASPTRTFDVTFRNADGSSVIMCSVTLPSGSATVGSPTLIATKLAGGGGDCQFPDPAILVQGCDVGFPPSPGYEEQVYGVMQTGSQAFGCTLGTAGCSTRFEGPFGNEWGVFAVFGAPVVFNSNGGGGGCHLNSATCIDTGVATGNAGIQIGHTPMIVPSFGPAEAGLQFSAVCMAGCPALITFSYLDCPGTTSALTVNNGTWTTFVVSLLPQLAGGCSTGSTGFSILFFQFNTGARFLIDSIGYVCGNGPCPQWDTTAATAMHKDGTTVQMRGNQNLTVRGALKVVSGASVATVGTGIVIASGDVDIKGGTVHVSGLSGPTMVPLVQAQGTLTGLFDGITGCTAESNQLVVGSTIFVNCTPTGLSAGALAGISIGAIAIGAALALTAVLVIRRQIKVRDEAANTAIREDEHEIIKAAYTKLQDKT